MYDMAKRSLAFTVATGGLLLTGTGYAPADTAVGPAVSPGQAQAHGNDASQASPSSVSTPISVREAQLPSQPSRARMPQRPHSADSDGGASATSTIKNSGGILSGNTIQIPIDLGLNLCGNQVAVAGVANRERGSSCSSSSGATAESRTDRSGGIASGNTIQAPVNVPLNVCGNQAVILGVLNTLTGSKCTTGGEHGRGDRHSGGSGGANATAEIHHSGGILAGNIVQAPINVPINACGNQAVVGGVANFAGGSRCSNGEHGSKGEHGSSGEHGSNGEHGAYGEHGSDASGGANAVGSVSGSRGILAGNVVQAPVDVPVNLCGNGIEAVAVDNAVGGTKCSTTGGKGRGGAHATAATVNSGGILAGNVAQAPINVPVNACGNQVNAVAVGNRDLHAVCATKGGGATATSATIHSGGVLSGNSVQAPIDVPVNACGNQVNVVAVKNRTGGTVCVSGKSQATSTSVIVHSGGLVSGNAVNLPINVPVNLCGNQVNVVGKHNDTGPAECTQEMTPPRHRHHHHETPSPSPSTSNSETPSPSPSCSNMNSSSPSPSPSMSISSSTTSSPSPSTSTSASTPPETGSPSPSESTTSPSKAPTTTPAETETPGPKPGGSLAHTGTDAALLLGVAGAAVLGGLGMRTASRRRGAKH